MLVLVKEIGIEIKICNTRQCRKLQNPLTYMDPKAQEGTRRQA